MITKRKIEKEAEIENPLPISQAIMINETTFQLVPLQAIKVRKAIIKYNKYSINVKEIHDVA